MDRNALKRFGAVLALASLLVLNLHVLAHVFGQDHDEDGKGKAAPCALCQTVLAQTALEAAPSIQAPAAPGLPLGSPQQAAPSYESFSAPTPSGRGPPAPLSV